MLAYLRSAASGYSLRSACSTYHHRIGPWQLLQPGTVRADGPTVQADRSRSRIRELLPANRSRQDSRIREFVALPSLPTDEPAPYPPHREPRSGVLTIFRNWVYTKVQKSRTPSLHHFCQWVYTAWRH